MNNEMQTRPEEALITLEGEDGKSYSCQILDIFDFENQEYALLLKIAEKENQTDPEADDDSLVIMRLIQRDDQSIFQTIESDDEFERVVAYVEELARQSEAEPSPPED
jgi:uncharacterized protein YrzB (UPF0473 family)